MTLDMVFRVGFSLEPGLFDDDLLGKSGSAGGASRAGKVEID
jgi:hypothetical protein